MKPVDIVTHRKTQIAVMLALAAACLFGRLSVTATISAFENPAPTIVEQLAWLWNVLRWSVPALLIGILVAGRVIAVAAAVSLISGLVLLMMEFSSFVPIGSHLPDSTYFEGAARELGTGVAFSIVATMIVRKSCRWADICLTHRQSAQPYE